MKLLKKNVSLKLPVRQIQAVLSNPKHRIKIKGNGGDLTAEEMQMNSEFAQICSNMVEEEVDRDE